jgi:hypothetical protein
MWHTLLWDHWGWRDLNLHWWRRRLVKRGVQLIAVNGGVFLNLIQISLNLKKENQKDKN